MAPCIDGETVDMHVHECMHTNKNAHGEKKHTEIQPFNKGTQNAEHTHTHHMNLTHVEGTVQPPYKLV